MCIRDSVAGEESALVHWLDDNKSLPQYRTKRPHILKIGHSPAVSYTHLWTG